MNFIEDAIKEAKKAYSIGEIPVGAVVVKEGKIIGRGFNSKELERNPVMHAEIIAIREACKTLGDWRLNGCEMWVTLEPCPMCISAIAQSRIGRVYVGTFNKDMGACGSVINLTDIRGLNSFVDVVWLYNNKCSTLMKKFFEERRGTKDE